MSNLAQANKAFREKSFAYALDYYKRYTQAHITGKNKTHPILYDYAADQIRRIEVLLTAKFEAAANLVITAANSSYFPTLLMLIESVIDTSYELVDEILVFDFGLEKWQSDILRNVAKVNVFTYSPHLIKDKRVLRFDIKDHKTYFFKVYALHFWRNHSLFAEREDVNLLYIDSGIKVQYSLGKIFSIIDKDNYFFVDHDDVNFYYQNPQNAVVNILSPALVKDKVAFRELTPFQMLRPYIKANFFGIRTGGKYSYLMKDHLDLCLGTDVLFDPRNILDKAKQNYWRVNSDIEKEISKSKVDNTGRYLYGRHEQTVWSYLVARDGLKIHNTTEYNYTVAPGSGGLNIENWELNLRPKLERRYDEVRTYIESFVKNPMHFPEGRAPRKLRSKEDVIQAFLDAGKNVYLTNPIYSNIGFPHSEVSKSATVLLHRGSLAKLDQHKYGGRLLNHFTNIRDDIFILLGNGPSLADVDLHSLSAFHTFGLNAAYRAYQRINFWPKYFGCFDALVCGHHANAFKELIRNSPIEKFFFINFDDDNKSIFTEPDVVNSRKFQKIEFNYRTKAEKERFDIISTTFTPFTDMRTSGSNTIQAGLLMGYRKFILLGVDQNYVEVVEGAAKNGNVHKLIMKETPKENPNYWFADYQVKGDKFNKPNLHASQIPAWNNLSMTLDTLGIRAEIYNCSPITALECFRKSSLKLAVERLSSVSVSALPTFRSPLSAKNE